MSLFQYLQLQPIDPQDDGTISDLDQFDADEVIDLDEEASGEELIREWDEIEHDLRSNNDAGSDATLS